MKLPIVRCEACGDEREINLLTASKPRCENCGTRALTGAETGISDGPPDSQADQLPRDAIDDRPDEDAEQTPDRGEPT